MQNKCALNFKEDRIDCHILPESVPENITAVLSNSDLMSTCRHAAVMAESGHDYKFMMSNIKAACEDLINLKSSHDNRDEKDVKIKSSGDDSYHRGTLIVVPDSDRRILCVQNKDDISCVSVRSSRLVQGAFAAVMTVPGEEPYVMQSFTPSQGDDLSFEVRMKKGVVFK